MKVILFVILSAAIFSDVVAQPKCGASGPIKIIGSSTVFLVTNRTAPAYQAQCSGNTMSYLSGGTSGGVQGVCCANANVGSTPGTVNTTKCTDIGNMSRDWNTNEAAIQPEPQEVKCLVGDTSRTVVQLPVAIDGVPVFISQTANQALKDCLTTGITSEQIRFIFSNVTLVGTVADDTSGHFWNEICPTTANIPAKTPIKVVAPGLTYGTNQYFDDVIFKFNNETFHPSTAFFNDNSVELINAVANNQWAIGFMGYAAYIKQTAKLFGLTVDGIEPTKENVISGSYQPLGRRIYSNFFKGSLSKTACFAHYSLSPAGQAIVSEVGYLEIPADESFLLKPFTCGAPPTVAPTSVTPPCSRRCGFFTNPSVCCTARRASKGLCRCV